MIKNNSPQPFEDHLLIHLFMNNLTNNLTSEETKPTTNTYNYINEVEAALQHLKQNNEYSELEYRIKMNNLRWFLSNHRSYSHT